MPPIAGQESPGSLQWNLPKEKRRMCPHCRAFITTSDRVCPYCETKVGPRAIDRRQPADILGGFIPHARFTTSIILLINLGLFAATVAFSMGTLGTSAIMGIDGATLFRFGAKYQIFQTGEWWRLVTAGFLHGGLIHIAMNSWVLLDLGAEVEETYGAPRLIVFYFLATVSGFFLSSLWSNSLSVGASAGLFGLLGAMIALGVRKRHTPEGAAIRALYVRWLIYGLALGVLISRIDNAAHIGGLAAGFVAGYIASTPKLTDTWGERFWRGAAYVAVALTLFCFFKMYQSLAAQGI
jgi:rhomboid protease GluP